MNPYQKQLDKWRTRRIQMRILRQSGMPLSEIAKKYGISRQRVEQLLKAAS